MLFGMGNVSSFATANGSGGDDDAVGLQPGDARLIEELIVLVEREHRKNVRRPLREVDEDYEPEQTVLDFQRLQKLLAEVGVFV